jgi:hypothetical protein
MKHVLPRLLLCITLLVSCWAAFAQPTVTIQVDGNNLYYSEPGCGDCNGSPDPRWRSRANFNGTNYDWGRDEEDFGACGWKGYTNFNWTPDVPGVPAGNTISVSLDGWESDGFICGGDDYVCGGYALVNNVPITGAGNPPCQWNYYSGTRNCGGGDYGVQWSNYWYYSGGFNAGSVTGDQTICTGGTPSGFTNSGSGTTGNYIQYQWQSSPNNSTWTDIGGANAATYGPGVLTSTTYYRRLVRAVQLCNAYEVASNVITVTVLPLPTVAASGTVTICSGSSTTVSAVGSGGFGSGSYQWQSSPNNITFTNIGGAMSPSYSTPALSATTYYRVIYTTTASGCQNTSSAVTVTVNTASVAPTGITGTTAICNGSSTTLTVSGGSLGTGAQWEWFSGACGGIAVGTGPSITVSPTSNTNYFVRASAAAPCPATACASTTITISTPTVAGSATPNSSVFCQGGSTTVTLAGQTGSILNWQQQINGGGWVNIGNAGVIVLNTGALNTPGLNEFRGVVQSGVCPTLTSGIAGIQVDAFSQGGSISASQTALCPGGIVTLTLSGNVGSIQQWERQVDGGGWTNLGNTGINPLTTSPFINPGVYEYRALVQNGTCSPVYSTVVSVTVNPFDNAAFSYSQSVFCQGALNPSPAITQAGGTFSATPAGLSINASNGIVDLGSSLPNVYTITHTTAGACPTSATQTITVIASPNSSFSYSSLDYCLNAGTNPTPTATIPGGTYTTLNPGLIFANTSTGEINLALSQPGSDFVQYSLSGSCPSSSVQTVVLKAAGVSTFTYPANNYCQAGTNPVPTVSQFGGTFSATPFGLVFANNQTGEINLNLSTPNTYTVTYNSGGACPTTTNRTVTINATGDPLFFYSASSFCKSGTNPVPFISTSGGSFTSSPAGLIFVSPATGEVSLAASQPGTYTITYNTGGLCPQTYSQGIQVIENANAAFSYPMASYCQYDANPLPNVAEIGGTFTASPAGLVFANQFTGLINLAASSAGTYTITYTVPGTCIGISTQQVIINVGATASLSYPASSFCSNGTDPLATVFPVGGTFATSPLGLSIDAAGTIDLSASVDGAYSVSYTAPGLCGTTANTNVIIVNAPQANIQPVSNLCTGSGTTILTASPSGGVWSGGAYISASGVFNPAVSGAGSFPVNYLVSGSGGCNASATYNVVVNASPTISITAIPQLCSNDTSYVLTATPNGGTWSGNPFVSVNGLFYPLFAGQGTHPVIYTVNNGGCLSSATANITVLNMPTPIINPTGTICTSGGVIGLSSNVTGGVWSGGAYVSASGTFTPSLASVGNNTVTYTIASGSCTAQATTQVAVSGGPNVNLITPTPFCANDAAAFILANIPGGVFTGGSYVSGMGLFSPANATLGNNVVMYSVVGNNGCVGADTVNVVVNANPDATITYPGIICEGESAFTLVTATSGGIWSGGTYINSGVFDPEVAGIGSHNVIYTVTTGGCSSSSSISITVDPKPLALFNSQPNALLAYFTDLSQNVDSWSWNFGDGSAEITSQSPIHQFPDNGTYQVRLIAFNDCGSDTIVRAVMVNKAVGINENPIAANIQVFPNPAADYIQLSAQQLENGKWSMKVLDMSGKTIMQEALYPVSGELNKTIDIYALKPGVYFIHMSDGNKQQSIKFIKL